LNPAPVLTNFQHTDYVAYDPDRLKKAPEGAVKPVTHISNNTAANTTTFTVMLDEANAKTHDGKPLQIAGDYPPITPVLVWGKFEDTMPDGQKRPTFRPLHVNYSETESVPGSEGQVVGLKFTTADTMIPEGSFVQVLMRPTDIGRATASGDVYSALIPLPPATGTPKNVPSPQIPLPERANGVTYEEVDVQGVPHMKVTVDLKPEYKIAKWWTTSDDGKAMARVVQFEAPNSEVMSPDADVQEIRNYLGNVARDKSKIWYTIPMDSFKSGTSIAMGTAPNADADKNWADSIWVERIWLEHPQLKPSFNTGTAIPYLAR
jgi:hypothetical protein